MNYPSNYPGAVSLNTSCGSFWMELVLTSGLVSVILGTASGAQNLGVIGALGGSAVTSHWPAEGAARSRGPRWTRPGPSVRT